MLVFSGTTGEKWDLFPLRSTYLFEVWAARWLANRTITYVYTAEIKKDA